MSLVMMDEFSIHFNKGIGFCKQYTEGYISFIGEHFQRGDETINGHRLSIVAQNLDRRIDDIHNYSDFREG